MMFDHERYVYGHKRCVRVCGTVCYVLKYMMPDMIAHIQVCMTWLMYSTQYSMRADRFMAGIVPC